MSFKGNVLDVEIPEIMRNLCEISSFQEVLMG